MTALTAAMAIVAAATDKRSSMVAPFRLDERHRDGRRAPTRTPALLRPPTLGRRLLATSEDDNCKGSTIIIKVQPAVQPIRTCLIRSTWALGQAHWLWFESRHPDISLAWPFRGSSGWVCFQLRHGVTRHWLS